MNDALDILDGIPIAVAVAQTAVYEGRCTGPDEGDEALVSVPYVDHIVEFRAGGVHLEVGQLLVPEILQLCDFCIHLARRLVGIQDGSSLCAVALTENVDQLRSFAGCQLQVALEGAACVGVVVHAAVALTLLYGDGVGIGPVGTDEAVQVAVPAGNRSAHHAEEALLVVGAGSILAAVFIDVLDDAVFLKAGTGDEQGVLEVYLILLVVVVVGEFHKAEHGQLSWLVGGVGDLCAPNLIGLVIGYIVGGLGMHVCIIRSHNGVSGTVAAYALVLIQGLAHRLPGCRPVIRSVVVPDVDISAGERHIAIEAEPGDSAVCAALYKAVAAGVVGDHSAVFRISQVVCPGSRGVRSCDDVFLVCKVKVTVLHRFYTPLF